MLRVGVFMAILAALGGALTGARATGASPQPRTLESFPSVDRVAQDGRYVVWSAAGKRRDQGEDCDELTALDRRTGKRIRLGLTVGLGDSCASSDFVLGVGGDRLVWSAFQDCCNSGSGDVRTTRIGGRTTTLQDDLYLDGWTDGEWMTSASGDGSTLVYAIVDGEQCFDPGCRPKVRGGELRRVDGDTSVVVPGAPPAVQVSVAENRVLLVTANRAAVELWDVTATGRLRRIVPGGRVFGAALSRSLAAVLVDEGGAKRVELRDPADGRLLRSLRVPSDADELAVSGRRVVYLTRSGVFALRTTQPRDRHLATVRGIAYSLSYEADRVVWAEYHKQSGGRIREQRLRPR